MQSLWHWRIFSTTKLRSTRFSCTYSISIAVSFQYIVGSWDRSPDKRTYVVAPRRFFTLSTIVLCLIFSCSFFFLCVSTNEGRRMDLCPAVSSQSVRPRDMQHVCVILEVVSIFHNMPRVTRSRTGNAATKCTILWLPFWPLGTSMTNSRAEKMKRKKPK